jgi:hypothetical protein
MKIKINLELTAEEIQSLQNGLHFSACQFRQAGDPDADNDAKVIRIIHNVIKEETGLEGKV